VKHLEASKKSSSKKVKRLEKGYLARSHLGLADVDLVVCHG
jgi:hypothetical protein